ncbi:hypothetical protein GUITHDRAFT_88456 [Guillardia theta CCMP2712]|uniref:NADP-dependent oxidoreductase domain-containing protein n=2 Tax=Guillardia theta TaxID=55529 RepID=L1IYR3_GUITC|nr:hypothetical protein GUITHDRAFT_88456 [Guillardia theta CCMP2712]EKX41366.1 hypothetical protein GUITHDRAFT_88456 [Guillardia theta CCMP2712]|eukprot:XP_005828346.1 hypothetical protein GUITHDRAFT_88456 [Guillardia theta CCMP2712]
MGDTGVKEEMIVLPGDLKVSRMGVGAWAWGDRVFWGYDDSQEQEAQKGFDKAVACGVNLFDTAEVYGIGTGWGHSETLCGKFARECADKTDMELIVATKFAPLPNRFLDGRKAVARALRASLERLGTDRCDLYQLHWPGFFSDRQFWDGLADAYDAGLVRSVGVSNYSAKRLRAVHKLLKERDIPLATNQIQYSLLHRTPEMNGVKEACDELGVKILAYSPLAQGCLTGRYSSTNLPSGPRGRIFEQRMDKVDPLLSALKRIGEKEGKTCSQVALNWLICKDVIPIPGARNERQAEENCGALGWRLSVEDMEELDQVSKSFVDSSVEFPGMPLAQM